VAKKKRDRTTASGVGGQAKLYLFVEVTSFTDDWSNLRMDDDELRDLENEIASNPTRAPVVPGGGGARKLRRPHPWSAKGKWGGYRVHYACLPAQGTILLVAAWAKSERDDLSRDDYKAIGNVLTRIRTQLEQGRSS
jgi:hypothetical protein